MARFVHAHPNPWGWNPLPYCGVPTQFLYLPGVPYLAAGVAHAAGTTPQHAYRIVTAFFVCLAPVTLFLCVLYFTGSRRWALAAALAYTIFSPAYGLIRQIDRDRGIAQLPWRVQVLVKYGEGPHNTGLALLPLAVMALWAAARGRRYWHIPAAAAALAAVCLTNWIAALALAICCGLLLLAAHTGAGAGFRVRRALAAAGLGYLFACFWLTPTFVRTIAFNWPADSFGYHLRSQQQWLLAGLAAALAVLWGLFRWRRASPYLSFVTLGFFTFAWIPVAYYSHGADTLPESRRYALEFELFLVLAVVEWLRTGLRNRDAVVRGCAAGCALLLLAAGAGQAKAYVLQDGRKWSPIPRESTVEHRVAAWIAAQHPRGRVMASGGLRFRLNSWFDLPQVGGGFESGLRNRTPVDMAYQIRTGKNVPAGQEQALAAMQFRALGVEYVVVHGAGSREYYRDFHNRAALAGLPAVFRIEDDTVYRVPFHSLAHLVKEGEPGAAAAGDPGRPRLEVEWRGPTELAIYGPVPAGALISLRVNADPGWEARQNGAPLPVARDGFGFLLLRPRPAPAARIEMRYRGTAEQRLMAALSLAAWVAAVAAPLARRTRRLSAAPRPAATSAAR